MRVDLWKAAVLLLLVVGVVETGSWLAGLVLAQRGFLYRYSAVDDFDHYLEDRDPILGWPGASALRTDARYDASGSRRVPRFPDPTASAPCVSLFGDSFTWGDEVGPEHAYGNVLADLLDCRVSNFGVPGYGTDQAYLRYRDRIEERSPVVVLGHYAEDAIRNVNQFRAFLGGNALGLKPRFALDGQGELELLPLPDLREDQLPRAGDILPQDFFRPGGPAGTVELRFPYTISLLRLLGHYRLRSVLTPGPSFAEFYESDHPSQALQVTTSILTEFVHTARSRGQEPIVLLIPDVKDLIELSEGRPVSYQSLETSLAGRGIRGPDVAARMLAAVGEQPPQSIYGQGHFTIEGYALLARILYDWIREQRLLPTGGGAERGSPLGGDPQRQTHQGSRFGAAGGAPGSWTTPPSMRSWAGSEG